MRAEEPADVNPGRFRCDMINAENQTVYQIELTEDGIAP